MTGPPVTLETLAFGWGDAYLFSYARDRWVALRRDNHRFVTAETLAGLEIAIEADHRDHPVPREYDPPGATDYLDPGDGDIPDDAIPGEDTPIILVELRKLFPAWTISYSPQVRSWIARTRKKTICENSAVLLCMALTLIERRQRAGRPAPGWDPPPWADPSPS